MDDNQKKEILEDIMEELEKDAREKEEVKREGNIRVTGGEAKEKTAGSECPDEAQEAEGAAGVEADGTAQEADEAPEQETDGGAAGGEESPAQETDGQETEDATAAPAKEKKSFFGRKEKKDPLKEKIEELNDRLMRQMAEFDNFRKRTDKEKAQRFEAGEAAVLEKILPVIDNFERGFSTVEEEQANDAFVDGMNKVYRQLMTELENLGVKPIEAVGKEFDPNFHNAVMQVESEEYESGVVAQELQKGYMFHDTVLRHSMVGVAK